ncbi:hypothetical protein RhiirA4_472243 [Rhizophagus irregularis]|uniref:Uncharacterized protein n=1 Tax=Rhizophagus irregularis TaxID=588596 RepID=A0A2I1H4L4_9GLOM|nr:hypothetical protein RhiirA4_472243 [Rhizophagus irregularis]
MNLFLLFFTVLSLKVKVCPEYELSKNYDKGPVDWVIKIGDTIIIITESKREDINQDVSQNAIQLQVLSQRNKKKRTYNEALRKNVMYDIVLIGVNWSMFDKSLIFEKLKNLFGQSNGYLIVR